LRPTAHRGELTGYAAALDDVWAGVLPAVAELERVAAEPAERLDDADLAGLQYSLHRAGELVHGLAPPPGGRGSHDELADALEYARDATAVVADALDEGGADAAAPLVWEWRGALFRLRLARRRLADSPDPAVEILAREPTGVARPLAGTIAVVAGAALVLAGALVELWPLWSAGVVLVLAGVPLAGRP
jgi:hypothetical protein